MARSEFRYNRKRKHYSYLFKDIGNRRKNIVLTSKEYRKEHKRIKKNVKLYKNPNPNNDKQSYLIPIIYNDGADHLIKENSNGGFIRMTSERLKD